MQKHARVIPVILTGLIFLLLLNSGAGAQPPDHPAPLTSGKNLVQGIAPDTQTIIQPAYRAPVTLTQSDDLTIEIYMECGIVEPDGGLSWWRAFDLETEGVFTDLWVQSVDTAIVEVVTTADLRVNVYTSTLNPPTLASLTLLGSGQVTLTADSVNNALVNVPVTAVVPSGSIMVIETVIPIGDPIRVGFNDNGQTAPTYFSECIASEITDLATLFPGRAWIMQVNGDDGSPTTTPTEPPVETPAETPTATATETPVETPTATPTEVVAGTDLVDNGGFETDLTPWVLKNESGDKVKCNTETKVVANSGECAFQFKGVVGESSKIQQNIALDSVTFAAGDTLSLSLFTNAKKATASGKVKVVVKYSDSEDRTKLTADIATTVGYAELTDSDTLLSAAVSKIKLQISSKSTSGKIYVDDVSLAQVAGVPALLPLP